MLNRVFWREAVRILTQVRATQHTMLGIGKPSELAWQLLLAGGFQASFYDAMDDFPAFYQGLSRASMARQENRIAQRVAKLLVSSSALRSRWSSGREVALAHNACAIEALPPLATYQAREGSPVLGYVGTIGAWFDWSMVFALAKARPDASVRIIGPVFAAPPPNMPGNIVLLPPCEHADAMKAMQGFSAGLIPFKANRLTESVDPIKYYEYRALGLPVLSTVFGEMKLRTSDDHVFFLNQGSDLGATIDRALACRISQDSVRDFRTHNSWEARFSDTGLIA